MMSDEKKYGIKMIVDGEVREGSFEELALYNNMAQEALARLLIKKKVFEPEEFIKMMEQVKESRRRMPGSDQK